MEVKKVDITEYVPKLKNRLLRNSNLESYIIKNYSTNKVAQADLYEEVMKRGLESLVGANDKPGVELFTIIKEDDFNHRYVELIDWLESLCINTFGPVFQKVYVSDTIRQDNRYILELTKI